MSERNLVRRVFALTVCGALFVILFSAARGQGVLPPPPTGYTWVSQGVYVYTDSDLFSVDLSLEGEVGTPSWSTLNETLQVTTFDASDVPSNQHIVVIESTARASLSGSGSAVVVNLDTQQHDFTGQVGLNNWEIGGDVAAGPVSQSLDRDALDPLVVDGPGARPFSDGDSDLGIMFHDIDAGGTAPTDGSTLTADFDGQFMLDVGTGSSSQVFGSGSAFGEFELQTIYERFELQLIPEPATASLLGLAAFVLARPRRRWS